MMDFSIFFRITTPLRGLKLSLDDVKEEVIPFRITTPLRGLKLCENKFSGLKFKL